VVRWKPVVFPARILLATDGSEEAELAAKTVADLAETTGSELHVAHVGRLVTNGGARGDEVGFLPTVPQEELDREARELLEVQVEQLRAAGGASVTQTHLRRGRADQQTIVVAEESNIDLIAMGSRGLGGLRRALLGSVSDSVVRHAHCPVLVVRKERDKAV
jgi:nucleotide-binding universal stress UspA family protein